MTRTNLVSLLDGFLAQGGDVAVVQTRGYRREKLTYARLHAHALFWAQALSRHGIRPGDRVMLWGENSAEWMQCFWAVQLAGAIAVPMDASASLSFVRGTIDSAGVKLILRDERQPVISCGVSSLIYNDFRAASSSPPPAVDAPVNPGDASSRASIAEILYTSGTTAEPRGVVLTHGNFLANIEPLERGIEPYRKYERWFHPLRFVSLVPLSHVFGQFMTLFVPPLLGAAVIFEPSNSPAEIIRTTRRERATALIAVPRMLDALRASIERDLEARGWRKWFSAAYQKAASEHFLRRVWRFRRIHRQFGWKFWAFISGGAALSRETEEFFRRIGYAVIQGYGMTETASLISLNHPFRAAAGAVGKVLPGREFKLAEDGEILVRGENVSSGYWEHGAIIQKGAANEGWLRTGDLGEIDAQGNLRFRGRKKNVIVTPAGLNVYPEDLESALKKQSGVRDCVVVPLKRGENAEPCAVLLLQNSSGESAREAIQGANTELSEFQRIGEFVVWPEPDFPRAPTGKPRLVTIAARAAQILTGGQASQTNSQLQDILARFAKSKDESADLQRELNLSSLDRVELMSALEQKYQVELNETTFATAKTVADVERLLQTPAGHRTGYVYPRWAQWGPVRWLRLAVYYTFVWPATQILGHPEILGRANLRGVPGPVLVLSNHITRRADIGLILAALPLRLRHRLAAAMGGESLQRMRRPPGDWFLAKRCAYMIGYWLVTALFNVFPLPRFSGFRESFRFAGDSVDRGYSVLIFPEGEVNDSEDGQMAPFQSGVGLLAENLKIPIVPVRLDGVWKMKREGRRLARPGEITVRIGAPVTFAPGTPPEEIARRCEQLVKSL